MQQFIFFFLIIGIGSMLSLVSMLFLFPPKFSFWKQFLSGIGLILIFLLASVLLQDYRAVGVYLCTAAFLFYTVIAFRGVWYLKLLTGLLSFFAFYGAVRLTDASLLAAAAGSPSPVLYALILFFLAFILDSLIVVTIKTIKPENEDTKFDAIWLLYILFPLSQVVLIERILTTRAMDTASQIPFLIFAVLISVAADVSLIYAIRFIDRGILQRARYRALDQEMQAQAVYYGQVTSYYDHLRSLRHDVSNHIYTLRILLQENRMAEAKAYVDTLQNQTDLLDHYAFCEHPVTELFLSQTSDTLLKQGYSFSAGLSIPADIGIKNGDLICSLGNLIDLCVSGCKASGSQTFTLNSTYTSGILCLTASVPSDQLLNKRNQELESLLDQLASRYHGSFTVSKSDSESVLTLSLCEEVEA